MTDEQTQDVNVSLQEAQIPENVIIEASSQTK